MSNVAHSTLTGADLHESKGVASAAAGTVYIANGSGSGSWGSVSTSLNLVGQIADFGLLTAPTGWLECNGTDVSRTTYVDLWTASTIQQTGTRNSGSPIITGLSSTTNMKAGHYVGGSGIGLGATIVSVDSSTQITISSNASSSGSSTVYVSAWAQGDGSTTFNLPDFYTVGRFRRSRTASNPVGTLQTSQNLAHTHNPGTLGATHNHATTEVAHNHAAGSYAGSGTSTFKDGYSTSGNNHDFLYGAIAIANATTGLTINNASPTITGATASDGGSEARPVAVSVLTCIKY